MKFCVTIYKSKNTFEVFLFIEYCQLGSQCLNTLIGNIVSV